MVDYQTIGVLIAAASVVIGVINSIYSSKIAERQRQTENQTRLSQLFMQLYQHLCSTDCQRDHLDLLYMEWNDYEDFEMKYGTDNNREAAAQRYSIWRQFDGIGYLVKEGLINADMVYNLLRETLIWQWAKWEPIIKEIRERYNMHELGIWFEYLAKECIKKRQEKGLSATVPETFGKYIKE